MTGLLDAAALADALIGVLKHSAHVNSVLD